MNGLCAFIFLKYLLSIFWDWCEKFKDVFSPIIKLKCANCHKISSYISMCTYNIVYFNKVLRNMSCFAR